MKVSANLVSMIDFKRPYQQALFKCFVAGETTSEAARVAGCSWPTARKFRTDHAQDIADAQLRSVEGVLETLKDLLPDAAARLRMWLHPPAVPPQLPCDCGIGPPVPGFDFVHSPGCASKKAVDLFKNHAADMRTIRTIFDAYEVLRDVDFEKRLKALEKAQLDAVAVVKEGASK